MTRLKAEDICGYLTRHAPDPIDFTLDDTKYISAVLSIGVQFQITSAWCTARSIAYGPKFSIPLWILLSAISHHLVVEKRAGFGYFLRPVCDNTVDTVWWNTDVEGDGVVWPNGFGDLVLRWQRPVHVVAIQREIAQQQRAQQRAQQRD